MATSTPLARITEALNLVQTLRAAATPGPWDHYYPGQCCKGTCLDPAVHDTQLGQADAALIVALTHPAVLDAVEAVLKDAQGQFTYSGPIGMHDEPGATERSLALADAILLATKGQDA